MQWTFEIHRYARNSIRASVLQVVPYLEVHLLTRSQCRKRRTNCCCGVFGLPHMTFVCVPAVKFSNFQKIYQKWTLRIYCPVSGLILFLCTASEYRTTPLSFSLSLPLSLSHSLSLSLPLSLFSLSLSLSLSPLNPCLYFMESVNTKQYIPESVWLFYVISFFFSGNCHQWQQWSDKADFNNNRKNEYCKVMSNSGRIFKR